MQRNRAVALVVALAACGGPSAPDPLRSYLQSDAAPEPSGVAATELEVARDADYERAEDALSPRGPVAGGSVAEALAALDAEREAAGEPPLLFARAVATDGGVVLSPLDTRPWFDAHGQWKVCRGPLAPAPGSESLARELEPIGAHLRGATPAGTEPAVTAQPHLPALVVVTPSALWVNPQLVPLLPVSLPAPRPRAEGDAPSSPSSSVAGDEEVGVSDVTGGGRFDGDDSVEACLVREGNRCRDCLTGGGCDPVFAGEDGATECQQWTARDDLGLTELCCAGLLLRSGAASCVQGTAPTACSFSTTALSSSATLAEDSSFAASPSCVNALNQCLPSSGAGTTVVSPVEAAPSCGSCTGSVDGCGDIADSCSDIPSDACGSLEDGCGSSPATPPTSEPDNELTSGSGSGGPSTSNGGSSANPTTGSGTGATSEGSGTDLGGGTGSGGETAGGTATGGEVSGASAGGSDVGASDVGGGSTGADDSSSCDSCGSDSCGGDDDGCDSCSSDCSGADCSGGDCGGGCSSAEAHHPRKPWRPVHEATFAAVAPVLALLVRRRR